MYMKSGMLVALALLSLSPWSALATESALPSPATVTTAGETLEPFPAAKTVRQSAVIAGKLVKYDVTVGALALKDDKGKVLGEAVYTSYVLPGTGSRRPITFSFNGGPGAASAYLNLGILGPKVIHFGKEGDYASASPTLHDNPNSWLAFTDLVFIDPIGTGFSRARGDEAEVKKAFFTAKGDVEYLSRVIYDWLQDNGRMQSDKYLIGESYGGYRVPRIARHLQAEVGIGIKGITMVSPYLEPSFNSRVSNFTPLPFLSSLPSMAATNFERQGVTLDEGTMRQVEDYATGEFLRDYLAGPKDSAASARLVEKVTSLTGLDSALVRRLNGRIPYSIFVREFRRGEGRIGSFYDPNVTTFDPFPTSQTAIYDDPILAASAPFSSAMSDLVVNQIGWKVNARYYINNYAVNAAFERDDSDAAVVDLRKAVATDPRMKATIVHGWNDLACPYFASKLLIAQMPEQSASGKVQLHVYPGGHMFYARPESAAAFTRDLRAIYD